MALAQTEPRPDSVSPPGKRREIFLCSRGLPAAPTLAPTTAPACARRCSSRPPRDTAQTPLPSPPVTPGAQELLSRGSAGARCDVPQPRGGCGGQTSGTGAERGPGRPRCPPRAHAAASPRPHPRSPPHCWTPTSRHLPLMSHHCHHRHPHLHHHPPPPLPPHRHPQIPAGGRRLVRGRHPRTATPMGAPAHPWPPAFGLLHPPSGIRQLLPHTSSGRFSPFVLQTAPKQPLGSQEMPPTARRQNQTGVGF